MLCTMNVQLASPNVHTCRDLQLQSSHTKDCVPMTWSLHILSTQEKVFRVECEEVQWGLYLESPLCIAATTKPGEALKSFQQRQESSVCCPINPVQKNVQRFWWGGFHINRALECSGEERGGEDEKEKVMPRKLASFKLSAAQSTSLNGPSAVPNPLCPHDSTPGEVSYQINDWTINFECKQCGYIRFWDRFYLAVSDNNAISVGLLVIVLTHHHWVMPVLKRML